MAATKVKSQSTRKTSQKTAKNAPKKAQSAPKKAAAKKPRVRTNKMFTPTEDQRNLVRLGAAIGMPEPMIASLIINPATGQPISPVTLRAKLRHELDHGHQIVMMKIAGTMVSVATDKLHPKCVTAGIFLSKVLGRWREPEPEWSERKRVEGDEKKRVDSGWTIIDARPILEEPKPELLPPPQTMQ